MKINFIEDLEKDTKNWQGTFGHFSYGTDWSKGTPKDVDLSKTGDFNYLKEYLDKNYYKTESIKDFIVWLERNTKIDVVANDLEKLLSKKFTKDKVTVYITIHGRGMYDFRDYMLFMYLRNDRLRGISALYHEMMHFLFHEYYWQVCLDSGLTDAETHDLKEAFTVLLNPILEKRGLPLDQGYPKHQELRAKLMELWKEENNFESVLKKALDQKLALMVK